MAEKDSPGDGPDEDDIGRVVVSPWRPRQFDSDSAVDEFPLVGSRNSNRVRRSQAMLTGTYIEAESYYGEALAEHGLPPDFWLPVELAINWKSDGYPRYQARESCQQWEDLQREVLGFQALSATSPGLIPAMLADWEQDRALIARFDPTLPTTGAPMPTTERDDFLQLAAPENRPNLSNVDPETSQVHRKSIAPDTTDGLADATNGAKAVSRSDTSTPPKPKRSTAKGEAQAKLIATLTMHHKYADGSCLNTAPIGNNELARKAKVAVSTASAFFEKKFDGHAHYRKICRDAALLVAALKLLNQEFAPHHLFGAKPPGEDEREDDE